MGFSFCLLDKMLKSSWNTFFLWSYIFLAHNDLGIPLFCAMRSLLSCLYLLIIFLTNLQCFVWIIIFIHVCMYSQTHFSLFKIVSLLHFGFLLCYSKSSQVIYLFHWTSQSIKQWRSSKGTLIRIALLLVNRENIVLLIILSLLIKQYALFC